MSIVVAGVVYKTKKAACDAFGISQVTVNYRISVMGMSLEEAISTPLLRKRGVKSEVCHSHVEQRIVIVCNGVEYESISEFARQIGAPKTSVYGMLASGKTPEEVAKKYIYSTKVKHTGKPIVSNGVGYVSIVDFANYLGIGQLEVRRLMRAGLSPDEIEYRCELKKKYEVDRLGQVVIINGVTYPSKESACKANGVSKTSVNKWMRTGMSLEEAINSIKSCVRYSADVSDHKLLCDGKYCLLECRVCGRFVLLQAEDARQFKHSELCEMYEWK